MRHWIPSKQRWNPIDHGSFLTVDRGFKLKQLFRSHSQHQNFPLNNKSASSLVADGKERTYPFPYWPTYYSTPHTHHSSHTNTGVVLEEIDSWTHASHDDADATASTDWPNSAPYFSLSFTFVARFDVCPNYVLAAKFTGSHLSLVVCADHRHRLLRPFIQGWIGN